MPKKRNIGIANIRVTKSLVGNDVSNVVVQTYDGRLYQTLWQGQPSEDRVRAEFNDDVRNGALRANWNRN